MSRVAASEATDQCDYQQRARKARQRLGAWLVLVARSARATAGISELARSADYRELRLQERRVGGREFVAPAVIVDLARIDHINNVIAQRRDIANHFLWGNAAQATICSD